MAKTHVRDLIVLVKCGRNIKSGHCAGDSRILRYQGISMDELELVIKS